MRSYPSIVNCSVLSCHDNLIAFLYLLHLFEALAPYHIYIYISYIYHLPPRYLLDFHHLRIFSPDVHPADRFFALYALFHESLPLLLCHFRSPLPILLCDYAITFFQVLVFSLHHDFRAGRFRGSQVFRCFSISTC